MTEHLLRTTRADAVEAGSVMLASRDGVIAPWRVHDTARLPAPSRASETLDLVVIDLFRDGELMMQVQRPDALVLVLVPIEEAS